MSKVLLVEPHKVLQQALALSLFPEHDVKVEEAIDAAGVAGLADVDLLIIDAAALREKGRLTAELQRAVEASKLAILWIDGEKGPKGDRLAAVATPIDGATLQNAVTALLTGAVVKAPAKKRAQPEGGGKTPTREDAEAQPIELVDVVEEEPEKTK
jgi:hypothetical protein